MNKFLAVAQSSGAVLAGVASAVTAIVALIFTRSADKRNRLEAERNRREASIRDRRVFNSEFRKWADAVITQMSEASHTWAARENISLQLRAELSALLDRGRLFFLNESREHHAGKPGFPGKRPRMLECIFCVYEFIGLSQEGRNLSQDWKILFNLQARFVLDAQKMMALERPESTMTDLLQLLESSDFLDTSQSEPSISIANHEINRLKKLTNK